MAKKIDEKTMLENIENLRSELSETKRIPADIHARSRSRLPPR